MLSARHSLASLPFEDLVPPEILERPPRETRRHVDQAAAARAVDARLRNLARHEAACRRVLGIVGSTFLRKTAHRALGFARLGDYTRERLGVSPRELQSAAHVVERLADLPAIAAAFERGALSWTQVRLLTAVATPGDESTWIGRARGRTVRALEAMIRALRRATDSGVESALADCGEDAVRDGESAEVVRVSCPARVRCAWRDTMELASRVAGERLAPWQAAEAIAAEGLAGAARSARKRAFESAAVESGAAGPDTAAPDPDERIDVFGRTAPLGSLDWRSIAVTMPPTLMALTRDLDDLGPAMLDARLRKAMRALQSLDWQAGRLLRTCFDRRLYRVLGFSSAARYVRERLGMSTGKAAALVAVERRLRDVPSLGDAYREGRVSWLQTMTLLPVVGERHVDAWLVRAGEVTLRRLADEARWALDEQERRRPFAWMAPPPRDAQLNGAGAEPSDALQMRAHWTVERCDSAIAFCAPQSVAVVFRAAVEAFRPRGHMEWTGLLSLLDHVRAEWLAQPRHRDPIFARDGWRCTVPACSSRRNLHDHHVRFRSRGGDNRRSNRTTVCAWHHLHGIHEHRVRVWGEAPSALRWTLGDSFLELRGDRYLTPSPQRRI